MCARERESIFTLDLQRCQSRCRDDLEISASFMHYTALHGQKTEGEGGGPQIIGARGSGCAIAIAIAIGTIPSMSYSYCLPHVCNVQSGSVLCGRSHSPGDMDCPVNEDDMAKSADNAALHLDSSDSKNVRDLAPFLLRARARARPRSKVKSEVRTLGAVS